jgi:hypothetical protein
MSDRSVAPPEGLLTLGFDPVRFQAGPPACYTGLLAGTRTGLPSAGDGELMLGHLFDQHLQLWAHSHVLGLD